MPVAQMLEFLKAHLIDIITLLVAAVAVVVAVGGAAVSFFAAKHYGGRAGAEAAISYEEEKSRRARAAAFRALLNQVDLAKKLAQANAEGQSILRTCGGLARMPVQAFETAFVSGEPILSDDPELLSAVNHYLSEAYIINSVIDIYLSIASGPQTIQSQNASHAVEQVRNACNALPDILNTLRVQLAAKPLKDAKGKSEAAA